MKLKLLLTCLGMVALGSGAMAQDVPVKRAQNVFVELGGQGLTLSANYDTRFSNRRDGLGGRIGVGYLADGSDNIFTLPFSLNYLLGKGKNFFEIGLGATYADLSLDDDFFFDGQRASGLIGTMNFGYRLQPIDSGFALRAGFSPVFGNGVFQPYAGFSLGYTF